MNGVDTCCQTRESLKEDTGVLPVRCGIPKGMLTLYALSNKKYVSIDSPIQKIRNDVPELIYFICAQFMSIPPQNY